MVRFLLDHGARIDSRDSEGNTPFHLAITAKARHASMVMGHCMQGSCCSQQRHDSNHYSCNALLHFV